MDLGFLSIVLGAVCLFLAGFGVAIKRPALNLYALGWAFLALGVLIL